MAGELLEIQVCCAECKKSSIKLGKVEDGFAILADIDVTGVAGDNSHCDCGYRYKGEDLRLEESEEPED